MLCEEVARFEGCRILAANGNAKIDMSLLAGKTVRRFHSWGKHFLIELPKTALRVHFLMFGSYAINERKDRPPRLHLRFRNGEINLYSCAVRMLDAPISKIYDWSGDVMADQWDPAAARRKLRESPDAFICDALLDQDIFAGVGNIIKNEVLYRVRIHPLSKVGALPAAKLRSVVAEARQYSFDFLAWRRVNELRKNWLVHNKVICPSCKGKLTRAWLGETNRRSFFCETCQTRHGPARKPRGAQRSSKAPKRVAK
jgi:endonuclease VIII